MKAFLLIPLLCCYGAGAQDTLTLDRARQLALSASPLQQKKALAEQVAFLQIDNLRSNSLPRLALSAQATWQSDVFGLPIENPAFQLPEVPKDQYRLSADVVQRLWDGGSDRYLRQQRELERELASAQVDIDVFSQRELVTDLYFRALLLQENEAILTASREDLKSRLRQAEAQVREGTALRTTADQVRIQILKTEQQLEALQVDKAALLQVLAIWIGRDKPDFFLRTPSTSLTGSTNARPEHRLFTLQQQQLQLAGSQLRLRSQPRLEAFAQGGLGRPNPFNFFETGMQPFVLDGLRAAWTPIDWGNRRRDAQMLVLQARAIDAQRAAFDQRLSAAFSKDRSDTARATGQLAQDDAIIALQEDIVRRAEAQVQNGIMTTTDYLAQINLLTQARLARKTHELQALQANEMLRARLGY